jgi:hypothetical protein
MPEPITAERIFDKHTTALALPARQEDESLDSYVARVGDGRTELTRRLKLAVEAARDCDHTECHLWVGQARMELPPPR